MMWKYGDFNKKWQIKDKDVFSTGNHIVACGDLTNSDAIRLVDQYSHGSVDITYVDPPWNEGNLRSFYTKAGMAETKPQFTNFIPKLVETLKMTRREVLMECSQAKCDCVKDILKKEYNVPLPIFTWYITYYHKRPCKLIMFTFNQRHKLREDLNFGGMDDEDTPKATLEILAKKGDIIFDPCAGRGLTPITAEKLGLKSISMELNPNRMACILEKFNRRKLTIEKVGVIEDAKR